MWIRRRGGCGGGGGAGAGGKCGLDGGEDVEEAEGEVLEEAEGRMWRRRWGRLWRRRRGGLGGGEGGELRGSGQGVAEETERLIEAVSLVMALIMEEGLILKFVVLIVPLIADKASVCMSDLLDCKTVACNELLIVFYGY